MTKTSRNIKMKKLITGVLLSACIATTAYAGGKHSDERKGHDFFPIHKMVRVLDLTEDQQEALKALKDELKAERRATREAKEGSTSIRAQFAALNPNDANYEQEVNELAELQAEKAKARFLQMADVRVKISEILTDEQIEKFEAMKDKRSKRGGHRHHGEKPERNR
jgi:protein CpxP